MASGVLILNRHSKKWSKQQTSQIFLLRRYNIHINNSAKNGKHFCRSNTGPVWYSDRGCSFLKFQNLVSAWVQVYLLAPPASGDTTHPVLQSGMFSLIHLRTAGSAYKLSTGMSKNPYKNKIPEIWYSGGSNTERVQISDGPKLFHWRMVWFSNGLDKMAAILFGFRMVLFGFRMVGSST